MDGEATSGVPRCSIVVPVFGRAELTARCLDALLEHTGEEPEFEVIVVDDGSADATGELLAERASPRLRVVRHEVNAGFAVSCNDGASAARGELLVFLNNDTVPRPGWLAALVRYADEHPKAAVVGAKLLFPDGSVQHAGVAICQDRCPRHVYAGLPGTHPAVCKSRQFQIVTAACALVRRSAFEEAGGFDVTFVNGYEDADLCLRLRELGYEVHFCHESVVDHLESVTRGSLGWTYGLSRFLERWGERLVPDDFRYYAEDGLLRLEYDAIYPFRIIADPQVALVRQSPAAIDELLDRRAIERQALLKENIRLTAELLAARSAKAAPTTPRRAAPPAGGARAVSVVARERCALDPGGEALVTVVVPAGGAASRADELLERLRTQRARCELEILLLDDGGLDAARVRTEAARLAEGEACVFLDRGVVPADETWLAALVDALDRDERVAAVASRVLAHPGASPLTRVRAERAPEASQERRLLELRDARELAATSPEELRALLAFPTASIAVRTRVLAGAPFPDGTRAASDRAWVRAVLAGGHRLLFEPASLVYDSRERTFLELLEDAIEVGAAERELTGRVPAASQVVPAILAQAREDWDALAGLGLASETLELERLAAVLRRTAERAGEWLGATLPGAPGRLLPALAELARDDRPAGGR